MEQQQYNVWYRDFTGKDKLLAIYNDSDKAHHSIANLSPEIAMFCFVCPNEGETLNHLTLIRE